MKATFVPATAGILVLGALAGPARAQDEVTYLDPATQKETVVRGAIESESPARLTVRPPAGGEARAVPARDVLDVVYGIPLLLRQEYRTARAAEVRAERSGRAEEQRRDRAAALKGYRELLPRLTDDRARRHVRFRVAALLAETAEGDVRRSAEAKAALSQFLKEYPRSWQVLACADLLAGLQTVDGDWKAARQTYRGVLASPDLPADARRELELREAETLVQGKEFTEAEKKMRALAAGLPEDSAQAVAIQVALAECQAAAGKGEEAARGLEQLIPRIPDPALRARAYNTLGDCHRAAGRPRDALWDYLWVDVIYHQDRREHARALYHLARLFAEFKDEGRAREYRKKLDTDPQFAGLEYQRRSLSGR